MTVRGPISANYKKTARDFLAMIAIVAIALRQLTKCIAWTRDRLSFEQLNPIA